LAYSVLGGVVAIAGAILCGVAISVQAFILVDGQPSHVFLEFVAA